MTARARWVVALVAVGTALLLSACIPLPEDFADDPVLVLEESLYDAGLDEPYVYADSAKGREGRGVIVWVTIDSHAPDDARWQDEVRKIARLTWTEGKFRLLGLTVQSRSSAPWLEGELASPVVFSRGQLQREFGARPAALDARGDDLWGEPFTDAPAAPEAAPAAEEGRGWVPFAVVGGLLGALLLIVLVLARWTRRRPAEPQWGSGWPYAPGGDVWAPHPQAGGWRTQQGWPPPSGPGWPPTPPPPPEDRPWTMGPGGS